ncbi:MAG: GatB/YqeY domain-containing protein [bacterium]|nr:GatB/YqeY domain-containing protein [bacterium]
MSPLETRIHEDMIVAMKEKRAHELVVLRQLRAAIKNAAIDSSGELSDDDVLNVIRKEYKKLNDSLSDFIAASRTDLATSTKEEITIVQSYLPASLSSDEIRVIAQKVYNEIKEQGRPVTKGPLMGAVMKEIGARAQGNDVIPIIDELIQ